MLHFQLKEIPEDFFVDIVSRSNFLTVTLQVSVHLSVKVLQYNCHLSRNSVTLLRPPIGQEKVSFITEVVSK